jgi:hypothetical protein
VKKLLVILALPATFIVLAPLVAAGCKSDPPEDTGPSPTLPDGAPNPNSVNPSCANIGPVNPIPECDECTRSDQCCPTVADCVTLPDCQALMQCLGKCKTGDESCTESCNSQHEQGKPKLDLVSQCAQARCEKACGVVVDVGDAG